MIEIIAILLALGIPVILLIGWWKNCEDTEKLHEKWRNEKDN